HGTWCATCIGGNLAKDTYLSRRTKQDVICEGIAPKCKILAIKSLGYYIGTGTSSQVIEGIEYAISRKANILSMSLGRSEPEEEKPEDDPYYYAFEKCEEAGLIPVVANGNDGPNEGTVGSPGNMPNCLSVGAWNPITGNVADFSSRGPTKWGDIKPDCIMPGVDIDSGTVGLCDLSKDSTISRFSPLSGTSMATPHASGMLALMAEAYKKKIGKPLTLAEVKKMLESLQDHPKNNDAGWGVLSWSKIKEWAATEHGVEL
ncbi:MAG: S8 family serine peptidase, partial [Candidatus Caldarchaeum sp.]